MHPFINKLLCFLLSIALVVALAVPVFAAADYPDPSAYLTSDYPSGIITYDEHSNRYYLHTSGTPFIKDSDGYKASLGAPVTIKWYYADTGATKWILGGTGQSNFFTNVIWHTEDLIYNITYCDGSSCPATDADHNNICDDCGNVLAYNLRSTLLDFAKSHASNFPHYPYFAVVEHPTEANAYNLYMANVPMKADSSGEVVSVTTNLFYCKVYTDDDGAHVYTGNSVVDNWTGNLIYANHDIENFRKPPLAAIIQGVTGEALEMEIPNLIAEARIIVLCGVGCLALLILLVLLSTKLKRYLKG